MTEGNSPLKGSIRTTAGTAAGSGPRRATPFWRLLPLFPSSTASAATGTPPKKTQKKKSRNFLPVSSLPRVHYASVKAVASWRGRGRIHALVPVTHACHAGCGRGGNVDTAKEEKVCGHACSRNPSCVQVAGTLLHGYDITLLPLSTFNGSSW